MMRKVYRLYLIIVVALLTALVALPGLQIGMAQAQGQQSPLLHNSRDPVYRNPGGAVPAGTNVILRIRTKKDALDVAVLRLYDRESQQETFYDMHKALNTPDGLDFWEYKVTHPSSLTVLDFRLL